ncbi:hypothetical protein HYW55_06655 [Candidatus Gottesmanbacteria bacterium]|nr:hypothetical protein [Candidatus Gottesmanbacteria bacterium]
MNGANGRIHIYRSIVRNGLEIRVGRKKKYLLTYPTSIWQEFPEVYRQTFADSLTYFMTMHLSLVNAHSLVYHFPPPITEPFFFKGMIYSLGETVLTDSGNVTMTELLRLFYNKSFGTEFLGRPRYARFKNVNRNSWKRAVIPFSFGKDSLLTFALTRELGITPYPVFFREPHSAFENRHKAKLASRFFDEFDIDVNFYPLTAGWLRQTEDKLWGWDLLLTQYTMLLIPFIFGIRSKYLFWAHEAGCNDTFIDREGFIVNPVFEQSAKWLLSSNAMAKALGCNAIFASLIEPLNDLAILKILHFRYPEIGKYQLSCFADEEPSKTRRWCGICSKCARIYIFLVALGIDPKRVGFTQVMLGKEKRRLFPVFPRKSGVLDSAYDQSGLGRDEQILAFTMAVERGVNGELIHEFKKMFGREARSRKKELKERFFSVYPSRTITYELKKPLYTIYEEELKPLRTGSF